MTGGRERLLGLILLGGAILALGSIAVSLIPGFPSARWLLAGIYLLFATPWVVVLTCWVTAAAEGAWRRLALLSTLVILAAMSLV